MAKQTHTITAPTETVPSRLVAREGQRRRWINVGNGVRQLQLTPVQAAYWKRRKAEERAAAARLEADTCGLGNWQQPEGWDRTPYSYTVTAVDGVNAGFECGWNIYNSGVVVALVEHDPAEPYIRGQPYVWCKPTRDGCGGDGTFPTACIFGRFVEKDQQGHPVALVAKGTRQTIEASHSLCFRAVGHVYQGDRFYPRSEVPVPIPSEVVRHDAPVAFDWLQHAVKAVDDTLGAMAALTDIVTELNDAEAAKPGDDGQKYRSRADRQSSAYEALDVMLCTLMTRATRVSSALDKFHEKSPELAHWLKRWQGEKAV